MGLFRVLTDPHIAKLLLREEGEVIVDEVRKHWIVYTLPTLETIAALALLMWSPFAPISLAWLPMLLAVGLAVHAGYKALAAHMDRFVITNMRVFRLHGVFSRQQATMPLARILDISVSNPLHGRILGFGHLIFESAAQEQGLRDITYVARPDQRDLAIQRVVQRSGLRGPRVN